jgi:hypothetical protein
MLVLSFVTFNGEVIFMKKHIVGLAVFGFIVGAAAIIYAIFNVQEIIPVAVVTKNDSPSKPTACWNTQRKKGASKLDSPIVAQAVYNIDTKTLRWKLDSTGSDGSTVLYLFSSGEHGLEKIDAFYSAGTSSGERRKDYNLIPDTINGKLSYDANLYIMAEAKQKALFSNPIGDTTNFDPARAIPVTIDYEN